jgi:anhydro-N-acetylmuramic acid kinase
VEQVCRLDTLIGRAFAALAGEADEQLCGGTADLVVSHGQTVFHWVDAGRVKGTLQLGQPAWIAEHTGLTVVADLRARDIAAGGQGAPLVSLFDLLWLGSRPGTPVALNLGGIANITVASRERDPVAFDTGPANALIDAAVARFTDGRSHYDAEGAAAARGQVDTRLLDRLLDEPYYAAAAPKSTGKELFSLPYLLNALDDGEQRRHEDVVATLTALTARTVADAVAWSGGTEVIAAGGGTSNPVLMSMLATALGGTPLSTTAELGVPPTAKEAYAFATLGFLSVHGLAGTVASCTGARRATVLGSVTPGLRALPLAPAPPGGVTRLHVEAQP